MVLRLGRMPVWVGPTELVDAARAVIGWTDDAVALVTALPERVSGLLDEVAGLVQRITDAVAEVERLVGTVDAVVGAADEVLTDTRLAVARVDQLLIDADALVHSTEPVLAEAGEVAAGAAAALSRVDSVAERAGHLVDEVATTSGTASTLLALYAPVAERAAPLAGRFVEEFSEAELQAAIRMIDHLPRLAQHVESDILPILSTLDRVGPDVHQLLEVLQDVRLAIQGLPGFQLFKRRGERDDED